MFAPTDEAFAKLPQVKIEALLKDIPSLTKILTYHVVAGEVSGLKLKLGRDLTTVEGSELIVTRKDGETYINDSKVLAKIKVKNGVIYVIDSVLLPAN